MTANTTSTGYEKQCDACIKEHDLMESSCSDADYMAQPYLLISGMVCHKENGVYCTYANGFECNDCGKYMAVKFNQTNTTAGSSQAEITECFKKAEAEGFKVSSAQVASVSILFVTVLFF